MTITSRLEGLETYVAIKAPCRVATTVNITLSGLQTIDGVALAALDRVLVKNQTNTTENGIYVAGSSDWERAFDFNGSRDAVGGTQVFVTSGSTNSNSYWRAAGSGSIAIETDAVTFTEGLVDDSAALTYIASGTGAVGRSTQAKLREWFSPLDFGAAGSGAGDDSAALAATKAAAGTFLVNGASKSYRITSNLVAGFRMINGSVIDSRTVTAQDDYSVVGIGVGVLAANTFIPEQEPASGGRFFAHGNHLVAIGWGALAANTTGRRNTAVGSRTLLGNTTGYYNTALGSHVLEASTTGYENTGGGVQSLQSISTGNGNTGFGLSSCNKVSTGNYNAGFGYAACGGQSAAVLTGSYNTCSGYRAGGSLQGAATDNCMYGRDAGVSTTTGSTNTAVGGSALTSNLTGSSNVAIGDSALRVATGDKNVAVGCDALKAVTSGLQLTAIGYQAGALATGDDNTFGGYRSGSIVTTGTKNTMWGRSTGATLTTGSNNVLVGYGSDVSAAGATNQNAFGYSAVCTADNQVQLGNSSISSFRCQVALTVVSDERDKVKIGPVPGLSFVNRLTPFVGKWAKRDGSVNPEGNFAFLGAQDVEAAQFALGDLGLVDASNPEQKLLTYERMIPVLVQAVKELSERVERLAA